MIKITILATFIITLVVASIPYDENIARKMINISAATYYIPDQDIK